MKSKLILAAFAAMLLMQINIGLVWAETPIPDEPLIDEFQIPGRIEGIGTGISTM